MKKIAIFLSVTILLINGCAGVRQYIKRSLSRILTIIPNFLFSSGKRDKELIDYREIE